MKRRHLEVAMTLTSLVLIGGPPGAADPSRPTVVLQVIDHTGIPGTVMALARAHAERVFGAIGIHVVWSDRTDGRCGLGFFVTLLPTAGIAHVSSRDETDENLVGWASKADSRAFVYPDRVRTLAMRTRRDFGVLLGRVIAHEVGHLTLSSGHSRTGIMAHGIDTRPTSLWALFTPDQGRAIRDLLERQAGPAADRDGC